MKVHEKLIEALEKQIADRESIDLLSVKIYEQDKRIQELEKVSHEQGAAPLGGWQKIVSDAPVTIRAPWRFPTQTFC